MDHPEKNGAKWGSMQTLYREEPCMVKAAFHASETAFFIGKIVTTSHKTFKDGAKWTT
jgi:hypothetical protein